MNITVINIGTLSMNRYWGESERFRTPSATCTLIETGTVNLLVDPSPYPEQLEEKLFAARGVKPDFVHAVFLTHFHGDHRFGIELFSHADFLMATAGIEEWRTTSAADAPLIDRFQATEEKLPTGIDAIATPGHTFAHHSLSLETEDGKLIIAGDAAMTRDFLREETGFHNSADFDQASETIRHLKATADVIIPGHDNILLNKRS